MRWISKLSLLTVCLFIGSTATASEITMADIDGPGCDNILGSKICITLLVEGEIEKGDGARLRQMIDKTSVVFSEKFELKARVGKIHFNSPGGDLYEAMKVGQLIRQEMITTQVTRDSLCYSACVIAYLGGVLRIPVGPIGIHSFYSNEFIGASNFAEASKRYNEILSQLESYLRELRIPVSFLDEMKKVPHYNLKKLEFEDLERYGVIGVDPLYAQMKPKKQIKPKK